jgi:hypothetical protein
MRQHAHLAAMVSFVSDHVAQHLRANGPRLGPAISSELHDATLRRAERFGQHLFAACGALSQRRTGLLWRTVGTFKLRGNFEVRRGEPDPLTADVVHVRKDCRDSADAAGRFGFPDGGIKTLNEELIHAIVDGKNLDGRAIQLSMNLRFTFGHGSVRPPCGLDLEYLRSPGCPTAESARRRKPSSCDNLDRAALNELVAQLVEHRPFKALVLGSSPSELTIHPRSAATFNFNCDPGRSRSRTLRSAQPKACLTVVEGPAVVLRRANRI